MFLYWDRGSIATNMRVRGGGAYYLISRRLGVEFGGVIAVFFYITQAVAVTHYVIGFTEAVFSAFPAMGLSFRAVGAIIHTIVFTCVYIGAGWAIRIQYGILAVLLLSVLSFFMGAGMGFSPEVLGANLAAEWTPPYSFLAVFALFFPAVTGIMAGVNMSGDLRDPGRSIPSGTLAAIGVSTLIYAGICVLMAGAVPRPGLLGEGFVMKDHPFFPSLIYAGVFCATLSSALGSMMGAPRILQAFARDNIFHFLRWFGRGSGSAGEPRRATVLTFLIAQIGILAGDLNTIAPVITMFFLMTYAAVNLACFYQGRSSNPSFRPTFRFNHWSIALFGALACLGVMFLINILWAAVALVLGAALYFFIARAEIRVKWGDLDGGVVSIGQVIRGKLEDLFERRREAEIIQTVVEMKRSLIIVATEQEQEKTIIPKETINLWWDSAQNGQLMLLLAFMLKKNREWRGHPILIIQPVVRKADIGNIDKEMRAMLAQARIEAELVIVPAETPLHAVRRRMQPSALLFVGFNPGGNGDPKDLFSKLQRAVDLLGDVILIYNAGDVSIEA